MGQHLHPIKESILMCVCVFKLCLPLTYKKEHRKDNFPKDVGVSTILMQADLSQFEPNLVLHRAFQASQCSKPNQNNNNTSKRALSLSGWGGGSVVKSIRCSDRGPEFGSRHLCQAAHNYVQFQPSSGLHGCGTHVCACARSFAVLRLCVHVCTYITKK